MISMFKLILNPLIDIKQSHGTCVKLKHIRLAQEYLKCFIGHAVCDVCLVKQFLIDFGLSPGSQPGFINWVAKFGLCNV